MNLDDATGDTMQFEPHPYALLLPALTGEEYSALKANIKRFGILHPIITDADGRVLDGVHRCRIAAELGIDLPVSQMGHLTQQEKLQLAIGVNVRRRHLDADRRRELVRRLRDEQRLSVREIAAATGWSKSTVGRDLTPPAAVPSGTASGNGPLDEVFDGLVERWESEHPEPRPEDYGVNSDDLDDAVVKVPDDIDGCINQFRYLQARIDHFRDYQVFIYRQILEHAGELVTEPLGLAQVLEAHAGIRFVDAERQWEQPDSTPEDYTQAQHAWVAYVAARDEVAALVDQPSGVNRPVEFCDLLFHPALQGAADEADQ